MWRTTRDRYGAVNTLTGVVVVLLSFVLLTPSSVVAATAEHFQTNRKAPRAVTRLIKPPTKILNPDHDILIRLEKGQRALEKHATDLEAAIQKQVSQLSRGIEDSRKETQQMLEATGKRIKLTQQLLTIVIALLVVSCGGVFYLARRLRRLESELSVRVMKPNQQADQAVEWQEGEPPKG